MAKIGLILPSKELLEAAKAGAARHGLDLAKIETPVVINPEQTTKAIEDIVGLGGEIIISRGTQAHDIKKRFSLPVVEIRITAHEVCAMVDEARALTEKELPFVALIGPENMYCDFSHLDFLALHKVKFKHFIISNEVDNAMEIAADEAAEAGADVIIGGNTVCSRAAQYGIPSVRSRSGAESLDTACRIAKHMSDALDYQKRNYANFRAILDYTNSGIIQLDETGAIQHVNRLMERMLNSRITELQGLDIWDVIPAVDEEMLKEILMEGKEIYARRIKIRRSEFIISITPVMMDNKKITGAIISFYEGKQIEILASAASNVYFKHGRPLWHSFDTLIARSETMRAIIDRAKQFARYSCPLLILGERGCGQIELAECIHQESRYKSLPFTVFYCDGYSPEEGELILFGGQSLAGEQEIPGIAEEVSGVLYLHQVSALSPSAQYKLLRLIQKQETAPYGSYKTRDTDIRIIATDSTDIKEAVRKGAFRGDLYYQLSAAQIIMPPLRQRKEDIDGWIEYFMTKYEKSYGRTVRLTNEALKFLHNYDWPGNIDELGNICQRILSSSPRRIADEKFIAAILEPDLYDFSVKNHSEIFKKQDKAMGNTREVIQIENLLLQYNGNRTAVAQAMGISTTTLWRKMKKLNLL